MHTIRKILRIIWQCGEAICDRFFRHGCDFARWHTQEELGFSPDHGVHYQPSTNALSTVLRRLNITPQDAIIDIGCGKGKAMYLMSKFSFGRIAGLDISPDLVAIANKNFAVLGLKQCHSFVADAEEYDDYDDFNYFYLFNPVPELVFRPLIAHIENSVRRKPRVCTLIYLNPVYDGFLLKETGFKFVSERKSWISWFVYRCYRLNPNEYSEIIDE